MSYDFNKNWTTDNNGYPLNSDEVNRLISVKPTPSQCRLSQKPFYLFMHFGMNTATRREWGSGKEKASDFNIKTVKPETWIECAKAAGATGIILTCKHHDGFCLWDTKYTDFCVRNSGFDGDIVKMVSDACHKAGLDFGVYLSPWDMHESTYATEAYNDYFCNQLTELLTNYGEIFEVWFDGAKGKEAKAFNYDWDRYYALIRKLQPNANISICGPDIRWVGNEGGKTRKSEFSVVPFELTRAETVEKNSQHADEDASKMKNITSMDEDLGSRELLAKRDKLWWYPAEVDVSIRKGWFWAEKGNKTVKSSKKLFDIYLNSVGNNCTLLLNIPPTAYGDIDKKDMKAVKGLGNKIREMYSKPVVVKSLGELTNKDGVLDFDFGAQKKINYIELCEDISFSQRVEAFDLYLKKKNGQYKLVFSGTIIGSKKIVTLKNEKCTGARLVIRQSRSNPVISKIGFYE